MAGYGLGTRIRATLARILIPGPGTDPLLQIRSGCLPKSTDLLDYLRIFMDFYGLLWTRLVPERYALACVGKGGTASKIWVKTRKIVGSAILLFKLRSSFFTRVEGGDRRPQSAVWRVGFSRQIVTEPLLSKLTSIFVYVFTITFHTVVRADVCKTDFRRG